MNERRKEATRLLKYPEDKFQAIDLSTAMAVPEWCTRAFRNNRYHITIDDKAQTTHGIATKVLIQSHLDEPIRFHWRTIQRIKNELFGTDVVAVEYYPKEIELVNSHNIYWIWIFPENILPIPTGLK